MRPLGRYQLRVRTLLLIPVVVALACWLAIWAVNRQSFRDLAAFHGYKEADYESLAREPIPEYINERIQYPNRRHTFVYRALSEAELKAERQAREQAARRAAYHRGLKLKYTFASWRPWFPVPADPPPPD
jgi:hypothetical protein